MAFREVEAKIPAPSGKPCYRCCRKKPLMLITINSATWYSVMPHIVQRYAAVDLVEGRS
jgi:hypothetical protein